MYSFILPRIESSRWHHNPKYLILNKFLGHLEEKAFSGFSDLTSDLHTFVLLFLEGKAVQGFRVIENNFYLFSSLSENLPQLELTHLILYQTPPTFIEGIMGIVHGTPQHKGLSTTFVSLKPLLKDLGSEKLEGTVTIHWKTTEGIIVLHNGIPENVFLVTSSDIAEGKEALEDILAKADEEGVINVYWKTERPLQEPPEDVLHITTPAIEDKIRSVYGQLGVEFLQTAVKKRPLQDIASDLCVDFSEIEPLCTYVVEKGYAELKKKDFIEEKTRKFWDEL